MSHQSQLEKSKYRNWMKGGLAYTYLKEVIEGFTDEEKKEKCLERRNELYKSSDMKLEDTGLTKCIDDILAILENNTELTAKLIKLKQQNFIITTHSEAEVCRDAKTYITDELNKGIKEAEGYICKIIKLFSVEPDYTTTKDIENALKPLSENTNIGLRLKEIKDLIERINGKQEEKDNYKQIGKRLSKIHQSIQKLEDVIDQQERNLKYVQEKQDLQCKLVELYQRHYVKTSLSPLKHQKNDINIDEVYVEPNMVVVEAHKQQTGACESRYATGKHKERSIHRYHDLFQSNGRENKAIYIVGDVGTGKSSFCKKMIQEWCKAATESPNESLTSDDSNANGTSGTSGNSKESSSDSDESDQTNGNSDEEELGKFDFLFYIPLQKSNCFKITDMAQVMCKDEHLASSDFVKRVFEQDSERCLFIIDGLDEWRPESMEKNASHESNGLPTKQDIKNATVITLSRPSAKGMLNIKSSEIDQKVELKGICGSSVENLIQKYLSKLTQISPKSLMEKIKQSGLEHLVKTPLFLQQIVWLWVNTKDIGESVSSIYCHLVNLMFGWLQTKTSTSNSDHHDCDKANSSLPKKMKTFPRCENNKGLLISLARVAFKIITSKTGQCYLSQSDFESDGVSKGDVSQLIQLGVLVEDTCFDPTYGNTQLSFIHMSYLEFFAAVYVSSQFDEQQSNSHASALTDLFPEVKTAADILQLSNLLTMFCGLCPFVIKQVSLFISDIVKMDKQLIRPDYFDLSGFSSLRQIEQLTLSFLSESDTVNKPMVHLSDVYIDILPGIALQSIIRESVISFVDFMCSDEEVWKWMTQLNKLQYLHLDSCMITHDQMDRLSLFIKDASLRCLSLYDVVDCKETDCLGHSIDLSHQESLQKLEIVNCDGIQISKINHDRLVEIQLSSTKTLDIELLRDFRHLTDLHLGEHISSMTYNKQVDSVVHTLDNLRTLTIVCIVVEDLTVTPDMKNLERICLVDVNMTQEKWCVFVFSLLKLPQSVDVTIEDSTYLDSLIKQEYASLKKKYDFVKLAGSLFELSEFSHEEFTLRTKKNIIIQ